MSHFTIVKTQLREVGALARALDELGYPRVEVHDAPHPLYGYEGDRRLESAEVIVRRRDIGPLSNDIGFKRQGDGAFEAIISEYDRARHNAAWLDKLTHRYAYHVVVAQLEKQGMVVTQQVATAEGGLRLTVSRLG